MKLSKKLNLITYWKRTKSTLNTARYGIFAFAAAMLALVASTAPFYKEDSVLSILVLLLIQVTCIVATLLCYILEVILDVFLLIIETEENPWNTSQEK